MQTRIGILGMGGVGGYFGGLLAKAYAKSDSIEIVFIARGETQKIIAQNGLKIVTDENETTVFPTVVSNDPDVIGKLDFLICATKTYDIEESLLSIKKCINKNTVILPLYNGVDAPERIRDLFPDNEVLQGCVYIVSMIVSLGVIKKIGAFEKLFFGSRTAPIAALNKLQKIFKKAGIESYLVDDIEETVWEKFIFISALASATSYLNQNIGEILESQSSRAVYVSLLNEITMIAAVKGLNLPPDIIMQTILKLEKTPHDATSSMHRDLMGGRKIELASLTEFVVNEGTKYEIETPTYQMVLDKLSNVSTS
ncbi:2-dehydropantoate 2-reductase [Flavobacterium sp. CG_23.5]|uniref:ketopantoate reductase family protein n=1 Tax=unclassified Flavobacterium TaxID=196869 RepID=UPI0018C921F7|nr:MULTISPECIES: 2-dehydropantoate 2-reductase [unclassified Flavobacterium]MBG6111288.1 2-dehydropantoate 2-reductase [Flavobacterium sp. CG_9.10]MBP2282076.1 2-dehydropantoate 2-reductase [Flavobacterium sp. CG_23.5]